MQLGYKADGSISSLGVRTTTSVSRLTRDRKTATTEPYKIVRLIRIDRMLLTTIAGNCDAIHTYKKRTSCYRSENKSVLQICSQAVDKLCSHCLFPVVVTTSLEQAVNDL